MKPVKLQWESSADITILADLLGQGQVAVGDSDTIPGFLAPVSKEGYERLNQVKKRSEKPYLVLINSLLELSSLVDTLSPEVTRLAVALWPGPLTLIIKAKNDLASYVSGGRSTIAVRIPQHPGLQALLKIAPMLFSTSANYAGQPCPERVEDVDPVIVAQCAAVVTDDDQSLKKEPSTILDCTGPKVTLIREGALSRDQLEKVLGYPVN